MSFIETLRAAWRDQNSLVCVGLDPDPNQFPSNVERDAQGALSFCCEVVEATADLVCAFKPQIAHWAALEAEAELKQLIAFVHENFPDVPVILDAKRGDIGSTAQRYATEAFDRFGADAVTLNPYMGADTLEPFLTRHDRGSVILCRTSNPGGADLQDLVLENGQPLYLHLAGLIAREWNANDNCMLVVGATVPEQLAAVRQAVGEMPLLVPGIGAQGGDLEAALNAGMLADGTGLVINSSRGVLYAGGDQPGYAKAVRRAAVELRDEINELRPDA